MESVGENVFLAFSASNKYSLLSAFYAMATVSQNANHPTR